MAKVKPENVTVAAGLTERIELDDAGNLEPSIIEIQNMLDAEDAGTNAADLLEQDAATRRQAAEDAYQPAPIHGDEGPATAPELDIIACPHCKGTGTIAAPAPGTVTMIVVGEHALDLAPPNSKIVVTSNGAVLATPDGPRLLPKTDPANRLPVGARILKQRHGEGFRYRSTQMSATEDHADIFAETAGQAIGEFLNHFHPSGA